MIYLCGKCVYVHPNNLQQIYVDDVTTSSWESMYCYLCNSKSTYFVTNEHSPRGSFQRSWVWKI